jgi:hypothetical protein
MGYSLIGKILICEIKVVDSSSTIHIAFLVFFYKKNKLIFIDKMGSSVSRVLV